MTRGSQKPHNIATETIKASTQTCKTTEQLVCLIRAKRQGKMTTKMQNHKGRQQKQIKTTAIST